MVKRPSHSSVSFSFFFPFLALAPEPSRADDLPVPSVLLVVMLASQETTGSRLCPRG